MADTKISAATDATSLLATDMLPIARSGSTSIYRGTLAEVSSYTNAHLPIATTLVTGTVKADGSTVTVDVDGTIHGATPSSVLPTMDGTAAIGTATKFARSDHVHPSDTSRLAVSGGSITGPLDMAAVGFNGTAHIGKPTVTGSRGGNAALQSLLSALASYGLIVDSSSA